MAKYQRGGSIRVETDSRRSSYVALRSLQPAVVSCSTLHRVLMAQCTAHVQLNSIYYVVSGRGRSRNFKRGGGKKGVANHLLGKT